MYHLIAAAQSDPASSAIGYYFTQGVLGVSVVALALTIRFLFNYFTRKLDNKDIEIKSLNDARLDDNKVHANDYREMAKNDQMVLTGNAQANELLAGKIEAVRGK